MDFNFDATQFETQDSYQPIPVGQYLVMVDEANFKETQGGAGQMIALRLKIVAGEYAGRFLFENYNIRHSNPQTVQIAQKQLASLAFCIGVYQFNDPKMLIGKPFQVKVAIRKDDKYGEQNVVRGYFNKDGVPASDIQKGKSGQATTQVQPSAPTSQQAPFDPSKKPSWA